MPAPDNDHESQSTQSPWLVLWGLAGLYLLVGFFLPLGAHVHDDGDVAVLGAWEFFATQDAGFVTWTLRAFLAYTPLAGLAALLAVGFLNPSNRSFSLIAIGMLGYVTTVLASTAAMRDPHIDPLGLIAWTPLGVRMHGFVFLLLLVGALFAVCSVYPQQEARTRVRLMAVAPAILLVIVGAVLFADIHGQQREHGQGAHVDQETEQSVESESHNDNDSPARTMIERIKSALEYTLIVASMLLAGFCLLGSIPGRVFLRIRLLTARFAWILLWAYFGCAGLGALKAFLSESAEGAVDLHEPLAAALWLFGGINFWLMRYAYLFLATTGASEALRLHAAWKAHETECTRQD